MSLFNLNEPELLTFFAVLVRYSVLAAVLPFIGDRFTPVPVKVLLALSLSVALYPALVASGQVRPHEALQWGATVGGIITTVGLEVVFGLVLGFTAKLVFDSIQFGANLIGNFMGFAAANTYDPHQETQTQVIAEIQMAIAMLLFLVLDGHHVMLQASLDSYEIVGLGQAGLTAALSHKILQMTSQVIRFGVLIAAPVAVSMFAVNVVFGIMAKAMPQLNILVLSFAVSALVGLFVLLLSIPHFHTATSSIFGRMGEWMHAAQLAMAGK